MEGTNFVNRQELRESGVHLPTQAGISGSALEGADSIVLSGGYEDDRDPVTGRQVKHQQLVRGNLALAVSHRDGLPVRVTRGSRHASAFAPAAGYRYAGLYRVDDHWRETGKSGFLIWRFRLTRWETAWPAHSSQEATQQPARRPVLVQRIVRDTAVARALKAMYDHHCQVCGERLETAAGPYAEAAHIRPLGAPHHGPDSADNLLCLCPNHHVLFDFGAFGIGEDLQLLGLPGHLHVHPQHHLNSAHLEYHRTRYLHWK
ncbi:YDG/SRA domain-containing protein [Deinococcus sp. VB343]|uniref:YDG/SRA domain-containing protein n=1 Tax=Deinococcus sp. VB343 TaxID=3385567 RepID=UPI0039C994D9